MLKSLSSVQRKAMVGVAIAIGVVVGPVVGAFATTYDPTSDLTSFTNGATSTAGPIIVAVAVGVVALAIIFWALRFVFGFLGARTKR